MTDHDDPLVRALHDLPTSPQHPLESIEQRARTIRNRRHAAVAGTALVAASTVAVPSVALLAAEAPGPTSTTTVTAQPPEPADCEAEDIGGEPVAVDDLPERMLLLWDDAAAPPPDEVRAVTVSGTDVAERMLFDRCATAGPSVPPLATAGVFTIDDGVVTRAVTVIGTYDEPYIDSGDVRTLDSTAGTITVVEPGSLAADTASRAQAVRAFQAHWPATDGGYWSVWVEGAMPDAELVELAESVRLSDGGVDLGDWSGADGARVQGDDSGSSDVPGTTLTRYQVRGPVSLTATDAGAANVLWSPAIVEPGGYVDVNGDLGVLSDTGLSWVTAEGVLIELSGADTDRLLEIARTVRPVTADDERLVEAWRGPGS